MFEISAGLVPAYPTRARLACARARVRACARVRLVLRARVRACACTRRGEANIIYCYDIIYSFGGDLDFDDAAKGRLRETFQFAVLCLKQILRSQQRSGPY